MSDFGERATWENQIALGLALDNLPFVTPDLDYILYLVDEEAPDMDLALRQLTPELYDLARVGQFDLMRQWNRSIRTGAAGTTLVEDELAGNRIWFDGLGALLSQSNGSYDQLTYTARARAQRIGMDFNTGPSTSIGVAFGHSTTAAMQTVIPTPRIPIWGRKAGLAWSMAHTPSPTAWCLKARSNTGRTATPPTDRS